MSEQYTGKNQPLDLVKDTFAEPVLLFDLGFTQDFIRSHEERVVKLSLVTGLPVWKDVPEKVIELMIDSPIIGHSVIKSECGDHFVIGILRTVKQTYFSFKKGHFDFVWRTRGNAGDAQEAVKRLFETNIDRGERLYTSASKNLPDYWYKVLEAVFFDSTVIPFTLTTAKGKPVPCRLYFDPENRAATIISIGGWCYDFDLNNYPSKQINDGVMKYCSELCSKTDRAVKKGKVGNGLVFKAPQSKQGQEASREKLHALMAHFSRSPA